MTPAELAVEHRFATTNGVRLHYVEKGPKDAPLVLLLHGFPEFWWSWRHQIEPLVALGYRVVAPDLRGYGESEKHGPYDLETLVEDVVGLIDALGERRAIVVAHDWGGVVAFHLAATRPERVAKLVVMNGPHPVLMSRALRTSRAQLRRSWYMFFFQLPFLPERWLTRDSAAAVARAIRGNAFDRSRFPREELQPYREAFLRPGAASAALGWYRAAFRARMRPRGRGPYPSIEAPTLVIWAMDDQALGYDELVPGLDRFVRSLTTVRVERCGHFVQSEAPERVNEALREFLGRP